MNDTKQDIDKRINTGGETPEKENENKDKGIYTIIQQSKTGVLETLNNETNYPTIEHIPESHSPWINIKHGDAFRMAPFAFELYEQDKHIRLKNFLNHCRPYRISSLIRLRIFMEMTHEECDLYSAIRQYLKQIKVDQEHTILNDEDYRTLKLFYDLARELKLISRSEKPKETATQYQHLPLKALLLKIMETEGDSPDTASLLQAVEEKLKEQISA